MLQAAGQAERSPSYLDKGSPRKSYQRQGVFKYSRNCSNHFLLCLQPHTTASSFKGPTLCFPYFLHQFFNPSTTTTLYFSMFSPQWFYRTPSLFTSISSSSIQLILARGVGSGADSCMTRNVSLCKGLLPPRAVLA